MAASDPATAFDRLVRVETLLWTRLDERLRAEHGIPLSWYEPMRVVEELGSARVRDIADRLIITEGGASKLVDRLQSVGHVERKPDPGDGRSHRIALTASGEQVLAAAGATVTDELHQRIGTVLGSGALAQLDAALELLRVSNLGDPHTP
ncbi:MarR family winged helix-turn-helix transcriptional regulator [Nocardia sp. MW-W600-9]